MMNRNGYVPSLSHAAFALVLLLSLLSTTPISAQVPAESLIGEANPRTGLRGPLVATRITGPFIIEGRVTEAAWLAIEPLRAVVSEPNFGAAPSERTEFQIAYDDEYLYVSGVLHDRDPDGIRGTSLRRDDGSLSNDWFAVTIDGYRDRENSLTMAVTPAGVRTDLEAPDDAEGAINFAWNAFWDAEVARTGTGWSAELRIHFGSLPHQPDANGIATMGITIWRNIARKGEFITWPAIEPLWTSSVLKASQAAEVEFRGLSRSRAMHATPYLLAGGSRPILPTRSAFPSSYGSVRKERRSGRGTSGVWNELVLEHLDDGKPELDRSLAKAQA